MSMYAEQPEIETRLAQMGLSLEGLMNVVRAAGAGLASTTTFHPRSAPGTYAYHEGVAALRRWLVPRGWGYDEDGSQPRTFSNEYGISIIIQSGDQNTGRDTGTEPRSRNAHGATTETKIKDNADQLALFAVSRPQPTAKEEEDGVSLFTWILLIAVVEDQLCAELSLASDFSMGKATSWSERILLPEQPFGDGNTAQYRGDGDEGPDNEVSVEWK